MENIIYPTNKDVCGGLIAKKMPFEGIFLLN